MILAVDIGNTNIVLCCYENGIWKEPYRIKTNLSSIEEEIRTFCSSCSYEKAVISSVVPNLTQKVERIVNSCFEGKALLISKSIKTGLIEESIPNEIGADLLCNLIAAHKIYPNNYVTVADFGTAFTTSTVSPEGKIMGVTIAPGMMTSVKALFSNTAQLPEIRLDLPQTVLGLDTVSSIRAGVIYGFVGQLDCIVRRIEKELNSEVKVIATGGFSKFISGLVDKLDLSDINLTLDGARFALELNS